MSHFFHWNINHCKRINFETFLLLSKGMLSDKEPQTYSHYFHPRNKKTVGLMTQFNGMCTAQK